MKLTIVRARGTGDGTRTKILISVQFLTASLCPCLIHWTLLTHLRAPKLLRKTNHITTPTSTLIYNKTLHGMILYCTLHNLIYLYTHRYYTVDKMSSSNRRMGSMPKNVFNTPKNRSISVNIGVLQVIGSLTSQFCYQICATRDLKYRGISIFFKSDDF